MKINWALLEEDERSCGYFISVYILKICMKDLPSWDVLKKRYPALPAPTVFKQIGGKIELNFDIGVFGNACATRVSKALMVQVHYINYHFIKQ